ncbi:MAG: alpha/beta hydrolase domain-containing protein [Casimicrobiaceae bacterium]
MSAKNRALPHESPPSNRKALRIAVLAALSAGVAICMPVAEARVVSVQLSPPTIAFGGYSWPGVGQYEKITGVAYAEVDPADARNAVIVDLALSQPQAGPGQPGKTPSGKIGYLLNFYILKPVNLGAVDRNLNGYGKVMYEPPNRGGKTWTALGRVSPGGNDPATMITNTDVLANSFLMPRGYTMIWSGWEPLVPVASLGTSLTGSIAVPLVKNPDGTAVTGPAYEYSASGGNSISLNYPAATLDKSQAKLTHRVHMNDVAEVVPAANWTYNADGTAISRVPAAPFVANDIYEFSYTAKDPMVAGLGFAAVRDIVSWLRYETTDSAGHANPLSNYITRIYTEISSQPGRLLNDFRHLGFNEDESGRKVFDGHMQWISAGSGIGMNYRFSQTARTERNRQDHNYPENLFPFANVPTTDPFTGKTDSRYAKCEATNTCPLGVEIYSANEYWVKSASLLHTTPDGAKDLPDSKYTRNYFMTSMQHGTGNGANRGNCQQNQNPLSSSPVQRALFLALDKWATAGVVAPDSRIPKLADGTMALPASTGFPTNIPDPFAGTPEGTPNGKVTYTGLKSTRYRYAIGESFYTSGIPTTFPPVITPPIEINTAIPIVSVNGPIYPSFAPTTDRDGNDIAGVKLVDVTVPLATYTGWALRRGTWADDGCEGSGQNIPFPPTQAARLATSDPRPAVAERYPTFEAYDQQVITAMNTMIQDRLLLCEDGNSELARLRSNGVTRGVPNPPSTFAPYSFPLANSKVAPSQATLWPPNGKMVPVSLSVVAPDTCSVSCKLTQISGSDGVKAGDWQITGPMSANLRSDRSGKDKNGRTYTMQLACSDGANMTGTKTVAVTVPHDQGNK